MFLYFDDNYVLKIIEILFLGKGRPKRLQLEPREANYQTTHTSRKRLRRSQTRDPSLEKKDFFFFFFTFQMILNKVHFFSL